MAPGNAWHFPGNTELPADISMRSPVFPTDLKTPVTIFSGNQSAGGDRAANQLQDGSFVKYKRTTDSTWKSVAMVFDRQIGNNKYFRADILINDFAVGTQVQYYSILAYSDRDPTFLGVAENDPTGWFSGVLTTEGAAQARPFNFTIGTQNEQRPFTLSIETPKERGKWSEPFPLENVGAHAHFLHTGKVLMWGRRDKPEQSMNTILPPFLVQKGANAKPATCTPFLLNLETLKTTTAKQPFMPENSKLNAILPRTDDGSGKINANLFCSGHTFQPNGDLLVAGGHLFDEWGLDQSCIYHPTKETINDTWTAVPAQKNGTVMGNGRWYPTVTALPTGTALVASGSFHQGDEKPINTDTQILSGTAFTSVTDPKPPQLPVFDLYPRMHVASSGIVYWVSLANIWFLDLATSKQWQSIPTPKDQKAVPERPQRDYACSVMYDKDKVVYIGGGNPPTATTDLLDLSDREKIAWENTNDMTIARRQHNATVLPDGSVLVTGGTRGDGGGATKNAGDVKFNDLRPGRPVHIAELWNPNTKKWTMMASEQIDRCYHSTAVLLPDGRVLSAGGGEFQLGTEPNDPKDSHRDAQIFSPPYLFQEGSRPEIDSISKDVVECLSTFEVVTAKPDQIEKINLIGLSSVTHSNNTGQRLIPLKFEPKSRPLKVTAPPDASSCPPGYYMLFIVNKKGVPSKANIIQILPTPTSLARHRDFTAQLVAGENKPPTLLETRKAVREAANGTRVELGITPTCPYGLSACWGGAFEALSNLAGVERVDPIPHNSGSTASVFLADNGLPNLDLWTRQFKGYVRETYGLRGFEAAVTGTVEVRDNGIVLAVDGVRPEVSLVPLEPEGKVQLDKDARRPQAVTEEEAATYDRLAQSASSGSAGPVTVTGPVSQSEAGYKLQVRLIKW
jgi:galactose oxidase